MSLNENGRAARRDAGAQRKKTYPQISVIMADLKRQAEGKSGHQETDLSPKAAMNSGSR